MSFSSVRFELLCDQAMDLDVDDDDEVSTLLEKFAPFSKDDVETLAHVKVRITKQLTKNLKNINIEK